MRGIPHYLIIGNGRVARHFQHYFSQLKLSFDTWHRHEPFEQLQKKLGQATHVLVLITDKSINSFIQENLKTHAMRIHFSGSLVSELAYGAHPLMCFNEQFYSLEQYKQIPFIIDEDAPAFEELLPGLTNTHVRLKKSLKAKYHALCVMSGNFSCLLWQKLFSTFEKEFNLPHTIAHPYLQQQTQNILHNYQTALTGPLVRNDQETLAKNLAALENDPFQQIYQSFISCFDKLSPKIIRSDEIYEKSDAQEAQK